MRLSARAGYRLPAPAALARRLGALAPVLVTATAVAASSPPPATIPSGATPTPSAASQGQPAASASAAQPGTATTPLDPNAGHAYSPPATSFPVTVSTRVVLKKLHPMARRWGLLCGAIATSKSASGTIQQTINSAEGALEVTSSMQNNQTAYDSFAQLILSPAHYHGSEVTAGGDVVGGGYDGVKTVTMNVPVSELIDPATKAVYAEPTVVVGCWITINERPTIRMRHEELADKDNFNHIQMGTRSEYVVSAPVPAAAP